MAFVLIQSNCCYCCMYVCICSRSTVSSLASAAVVTATTTTTTTITTTAPSSASFHHHHTDVLLASSMLPPSSSHRVTDHSALSTPGLLYAGCNVIKQLKHLTKQIFMNLQQIFMSWLFMHRASGIMQVHTQAAFDTNSMQIRPLAVKAACMHTYE